MRAPDGIRVSGAMLQLRPDRVWSDVQAFLAARAARRRAEEEVREGNLEEAIAVLRGGRAVDPYDERCVARLELLDRGGDRAGALRIYDEVRIRMLEELDLEPSPEVRALAERIRSRESGCEGGASR